MYKRIRLMFIMLIIWFVGIGVYAVYQLEQTLQLDEPIVMNYPKGSPLSRFFLELENKQIMEDSRWIMLIAKMTGQARQAHAGSYELTADMNAWQVLDKLVTGDTIQYQITLVEGQTVAETLRRLAAHPQLKQDLPGDPVALMQYLDLQGHPEGRFFPDTYKFDPGTPASKILIRAQIRLEMVLAEEWRDRMPGLPYDSPYDALIMASLIEKETGVPSERDEIAGVFVRRLERNMRLQTDPTIIYGLGDRYKGNIRRRHLLEKTPYNTYRINGLPPTPIALVGREAIHAALNPKDGSSLYFVAKGDGSHKFSETLEEHNAAVRQYQLNRSENYRSTPQLNNQEN